MLQMLLMLLDVREHHCVIVSCCLVRVCVLDTVTIVVSDDDTDDDVVIGSSRHVTSRSDARSQSGKTVSRCVISGRVIDVL